MRSISLCYPLSGYTCHPVSFPRMEFFLSHLQLNWSLFRAVVIIDLIDAFAIVNLID